MERFWVKVDKSSPTGCWNWIASKFWDGYGQFQVGKRPHAAHRVAWELTQGKVPKGKQVLHRCDNPSCVNPDHLWLGTATDNVHDKMQKGRGKSLIGEQCSWAKLAQSNVRAIKRLSKLCVFSDAELGRKYGVHYSTIGDIRRGKTWAHVAV